MINRFALPSQQEPSDDFDPLKELQVENDGAACFSRLSATQTMKNIAQYIGKDPQHYPLDLNGGYAIPSAISHIINYEDEVLRGLERVCSQEARQKNEPLDSKLYPWLGMMAAVLLKGIHGLHITLEPMNLWMSNNKLGEIVGELLHERWGAWNAKQNRNQKEADADVMRLCYLTIGGKAFAILNPKIGICPLREPEYDFAGTIPWCRDGVWENPLDVWDKKAPQGLPSTESQMLFDFLWSFSQNPVHEGKDDDDKDLRNLAELLMTYIRNYKPYNTPMEFKGFEPEMDKGFNDDPNWEEFDVRLKELMFKTAKQEHMPRTYFAPKLLLFPMTKKQYTETVRNYEHTPAALADQRPRLVNDGDINGKKDTDVLLCYLPPLTKEAVDYFGNYSQMQTTLSLKPEIGKSQAGIGIVTCTFTLDFTLPSGSWITKERIYTWNCMDNKSMELKEIVYADAPPYISLWPNVSYGKEQAQPQDGAGDTHEAESGNAADPTYWSLYYIAKFYAGSICEDPMIVLNRCFGLEDESQQLKTLYCINPMSSAEILLRLNDAYLPDGETVKERIYSKGTQQNRNRRQKEWLLYRSPKRPEQLEILVGTQLCGILQIPHCPKKTIIAGSRGKIGLDFGTTSSMCYFRPNSEQPQYSVRPAEAYLKDIIPFASRLLNDKEIAYEESANARFQWVERTGDITSLKKINTSMQANDVLPKPERAPIDNVYYPFYFARHLQLDGYVWNELQECDGISQKGVYVNLKFSTSGGAMMKNVRKTFFAYILTLAALEARENGVDKLTLYTSYPNHTAYGHLSEALDHTLPTVNEQFFGDIFEGGGVQYRKETTAAINYFRKIYPTGKAVSSRNGLVIVDIGGGTTDISVVKSDVGENGKDDVLLPPATESIRFAGDVLIRESLIYALTTVDNAAVGNRLVSIFNGNESPDAEGVKKLFSKAYQKRMESVDAKPPFGDKAREDHYDALAEIIESLLREPGFKPEYKKVTGMKSLSCPDESTEFMAIRCFSEVVKLRYLLLFYMIARHMKNSKKLCDYRQFSEVNVCLAGYGSRGLGFCTGSEIGNAKEAKADKGSPFIGLVQELMESVLNEGEEEKDHKKVSILLPTAPEKEEVVFGLLTDWTIEATQDHEEAKQQTGKPKDSLTGDRRKDNQRFKDAFDNLVQSFTNRFEIQGLPPFSRRFTSIWKTVLKQAESQKEKGFAWMDANREKEYIADQGANVPDGSAVLAFVQSIDELINNWGSIT